MIFELWVYPNENQMDMPYVTLGGRSVGVQAASPGARTISESHSRSATAMPAEADHPS